MTVRTRLAGASLVALLVVAGAACTSGDDEAGNPGTPTTIELATASSTAADPCSMLTVAEISEALGETVGAGAAMEPGPVPPNGVACRWDSTVVPATGAAKWVTLQVNDWAAVPSKWRGGFASPTEYVADICAQAIAQLGDTAAEPLQLSGMTACHADAVTFVATEDSLFFVAVPNLNADIASSAATVKLTTLLAGRM